MSTAVTSPSLWESAPDTGDGANLGISATSKVALYGATPVTQRASAVQAVSAVSISSNITIASNLTAWIVEVSNTLIGLGAWKGAA